MAEYEFFQVNQNNYVITVTINRESENNTFSLPVWTELGKIADEMEQRDDVRAIILNAAGKHFSAGIDLKIHTKSSSVAHHAHALRKRLPVQQALINKWESISLPVIAAIQGVCIGAGLETALACDIRIAADNARFSLPEVRYGISTDLGGMNKLVNMISLGQAKRFIFACEEFDAQEALRLGLVEMVVPLDSLQLEAMKLAQKIASMPPIAVWMAKKGLNLASESSRAASMLFEQAQCFACFETEDRQEAARA